MAQTTRADTGGNQRIGTGAGAAGVRAGLKIDVKGIAARLVAGLFQREDFGVLAAS